MSRKSNNEDRLRRNPQRMSEAATVYRGMNQIEISASSLMTAEEVMTELRISRNTLVKYMRSGRIPHAKVGRRYRFRRADIEQIATFGFSMEVK